MDNNDNEKRTPMLLSAAVAVWFMLFAIFAMAVIVRILIGRQ